MGADARLGRVVLEIGSDDRDFQRGVARSEQGTQRLEARFQHVGGELRTLGSQAARTGRQLTDLGGITSSVTSGIQRGSAQTGAMAQAMRQAGAGVRVLAFPLVSELSPALGTTASRMASVIAGAAVMPGTLGLVAAAVGALGIVVGKLVASWGEAARAQREFAKALSTAPLKAYELAAKRASDEIERFERLQQRGRAAGAFGIAGGQVPGLLGEKALKEFEQRRGEVGLAELGEAAARLEQDIARGLQLAEAVSKTQIDTFLPPAFGEFDTPAQLAEAAASATAFTEALRNIDTPALDALGAAWGALGADITAANVIAAEATAGLTALDRGLADLGGAWARLGDDIVSAQRNALAFTTEISGGLTPLEVQLEDLGRAWGDLARDIEAGQASATKFAEDAIERQKRLASTISGSFERAFSQVGDAIVDMVVRGENALVSLGSLANAVLASILNQLIQTGLIEPAARGVGAALASLFGPGTQTAAQAAVTMQHGGHLGALQPAIVGEAGPELFVPSRAGQIIPNDRLGGNTTIIFENHAPGVSVRPGGRQQTPDGRVIERFIIDTVRGGVTGGLLDSALGRRFGMGPRT